LAVVFITHKLHEAVALGDRISVLRQGKVTGAIDSERVHSSSPDELETEIVRLMFGESGAGAELPELHLETDGHRPQDASQRPHKDEVALELSHASARGEGAQPGIEDVSLTLHLGEVLGVAGVDGNGQRALAEAISGQRRLTHGELRYLGAPIGSMSVAQREKLGLRHLADDRLGEGVGARPSGPHNLAGKR